MCTDNEVRTSGECLYIIEKDCVLPKCAFEETEEDAENPYGIIETGDGEENDTGKQNGLNRL
jgi:hypothetical protein